jgi:holo-[acyl-carrier protein] synthase
MIFGIGTDLSSVSRLGDFHRLHGVRALERLLSLEEQHQAAHSSDIARFLAKRFAAKEALGKALGTGIRSPVLLPAITITHDDLGKPGFSYTEELRIYMDVRRLVAHLSLTDEADQVIAFVIVEKA